MPVLYIQRVHASRGEEGEVSATESDVETSDVVIKPGTDVKSDAKNKGCVLCE